MASTLALLATACSAGGVHVGAAHPPGSPSDGDALRVAAAAPVPPPGDTAIAAPPATFSGVAPRRQPPPRRLADECAPGPGTWAVVVGINDYPGTEHDLRSAVADADDVDVALAMLGVPDQQRLVLRDGQVTGSVLQDSVDWLARCAGPDATAVFFFAGHVRKVARSTEAMVAVDGATVTDAELARRLGSLRARRAWVVVAACYGGGFTEVLQPGRIVTGAAPADQEAYENSSFGQSGRSYLVEYMIRHAFIEGRAPESVQAAFAYASEALGREHPNRLPVQFDQSGGPLDLRSAGYQRPTPPTTAPPPSARAAVDSRPPAAGGGTSDPGTNGGGSSTTTTTTTTAPKREQCSGLPTLLCGSG